MVKPVLVTGMGGDCRHGTRDIRADADCLKSDAKIAKAKSK